MINICEPLQAISLKVQVITPRLWIFCDPKHVGVIFNYVSFKTLYDIDFNIFVFFITECISRLIKVTKVYPFSNLKKKTYIILGTGTAGRNGEHIGLTTYFRSLYF